MSDDGKPYIIEKRGSGEQLGAWLPWGEIAAAYALGAIREFFALDGAVLEAGRYRVIEKYDSFGSRVVREFDVEVIAQKPMVEIAEVEYPAPTEGEPGPSVPVSAVPSPERES